MTERECPRLIEFQEKPEEYGANYERRIKACIVLAKGKGELKENCIDCPFRREGEKKE